MIDSTGENPRAAAHSAPVAARAGFLFRVETLAALLILIGGLVGWHVSTQAQDKRLRAALEAETGRFLEQLDQQLSASRDVLEREISRSRRDAGNLDSIDWLGMGQLVNWSDELSDRGGAGLAVLLSAHEYRQLESRSALASTTLIPGTTPTALNEGHLQVVRGSVHGAGNHRLGDDLLARKGAHDSAMRARDSGQAVLHMSADGAGAEASMQAWLYAPVYAIDTPWSFQDRQSQFVGIAFVPLNLSRLLADVATGFNEIIVSAATEEIPLIDPLQKSSLADESPAAEFTVDRSVMGVESRFSVRPTQEFGREQKSLLPILWPANSIMSVALLAGIASYRSRRGTQAMREHYQANQHQADRIVELERVSADHESFAYVVSHDLRAPLRKLQALGELLEDEVEEAKPTDEKDVMFSDIDECLRRMRAQVERMDSLIAGIQDFSQASVKEERVEMISTLECIGTVASTVGVPEDQLHFVGDFPTIMTWRVRFEQVIANLIGNAFKYHHRPGEARVVVSVSEFGDYCLFSVRDNGPGIDPKDHERIFEVFEAIEVDGVESSGVGLSIVRTSVENAGGRVSVESLPGEGSVFRFTWPRNLTSSGKASQAHGSNPDTHAA